MEPTKLSGGNPHDAVDRAPSQDGGGLKTAQDARRGRKRFFFGQRLIHFLATPVDMKFIRRLFRRCYRGQRFLPQFYYPCSLWPKYQERVGCLYAPRSHD